MLIKGREEILIKFVAQAIPYEISCFTLPDNCCKEIEFIIYAAFGGGIFKRRGKLIGLVGISFLKLKDMKAWVFV